MILREISAVTTHLGHTANRHPPIFFTPYAGFEPLPCDDGQDYARPGQHPATSNHDIPVSGAYPFPMGKADMDALKALMEIIDRADVRQPSEASGIARRLATFYGRPDLVQDLHDAVRKTVQGRLQTGGVKAPQVVYAVMDNGIAVLGGIDWSGFIAPKPAEFDLTAKWQEVQRVTFRFPDYLGGLGIENTDRIDTETGPFEIILAATRGRVMRIVPGKDVIAFIGAARETARMLQRSSTPAAEPPRPDTAGASLDGMLRYLPARKLTPERTVLVTGSLVTDSGDLPGFVLIADDTFWFFDHDDCRVQDISDGNPIQVSMDEISSCSVMRPADFPLPAFKHVDVLPINAWDNNVNVILEAEGEELALSLPDGEKDDNEGKDAVERSITKFLRLIDQGIEA